MAIIQILKDFLPLLKAFQRNWINNWLSKKVNEFNAAAAKQDPQFTPVRQSETEAMLISLATGGDADAFYDLPSEQLVAQMSAASQIALDYPTAAHYRNLFVVLAAGAQISDIFLLESVPSTVFPTPTLPMPLPAGYVDARTRVGNFIQRNLDGLQISMSDQWQEYLQLAAMFVSVGIIMLAIVSDGDMTFSRLAIGLFTGIVGGYVAPVSRDIVVAIQSLRD